jgi:hypothetical protein
VSLVSSIHREKAVSVLTKDDRLVTGTDLQRVAASAAVTAREGTAAISYVPCQILGPSLEDMLAQVSPRAGRWFSVAKRAVESASRSDDEMGSGRIDFAQQRSIFNRGSYWKLSTAEYDWFGRPGDWEGDGRSHLTIEEPLWLIRLVGAPVEACKEQDEPVRGVLCVRYRVRADFAAARAADRPDLVAPPVEPGADLRRLPLTVWLDDAGRIRRVEFRADQTLTTLELFDFGAADPIALPDAD